MNSIKLHKPKSASHFTITDLVSIEVLHSFGLENVDAAENADIIIASWAKELFDSMNRFGNSKRYMLWNVEPIWMAFENSVFWVPVVHVSIESLDIQVPVHVMSLSTRDLLPDNYFFLRATPSTVEDTLNRKPSFDGSNRKVVAMMTYRNDPKFAYHFHDGFYSLNNERCRMALDGKLRGLVDIFGPGWPNGLSEEDSRENYRVRKPEILRNYFFNFCSENTIAPGYVTEKIWDAVANGCLPIYHAGKNHRIYSDFPQDSFIDASQYTDYGEIWNVVQQITPAEFYTRYQRCYDALLFAMVHTKGEYWRGALNSLRERVETAMNWGGPHHQYKMRFNCLPKPDWRSLLGKRRPVILDIGANDGGTSHMFYRLFPQGRIYSFEPDMRALARFKKLLTADTQFARHCRLTAKVVSDVDGEIVFYPSGGRHPERNFHNGEWDLSGSACKPVQHLKDNPWCTFTKTVTVPSTQLDTWAAQNMDGPIDLIWADVQGAEGMLIEGGQRTLLRTRFFYTEYRDYEMYAGQLNLNQILSRLPNFAVLADYGGDVLLINRQLA